MSKLAPPRYTVRLIKGRDGRTVTFDDAIMVPESGKRMRIMPVDPANPLQGIIGQHHYLKGQTLQVRSIVYTIGLSTYGEEQVEADGPVPLKAGYSDHYDEVFEHVFDSYDVFLRNSCLESQRVIMRTYTVNDVFKNIITKQDFRIIQFIS